MATIHAFHLLNDFSGSPKVLRQALRGLADAGHPVDLYTSQAGVGFLSDIPGVRTLDNRYHFVSFIPWRLVVLLYSQLYVVLAGWRRVRRGDTVYVNTLLPFGGAMLGFLRGARVIYHLHETSVSPEFFKRFLLLWVRWCASEVIYVSDFLARQEPLNVKHHVVWNAIPDEFLRRAADAPAPAGNVQNVLLIASLKRYKGIDEYVALARYCPELEFELVVNATTADIAAYFAQQQLPGNLTVYPAQQDVHPFYRRADVVLNLSRPDEWVETFGLTALEGMVYGRPVIVPPAGGIAEIVPDGRAGFHYSGRETAAIASRLREWAADPVQYRRFSAGAREQAMQFTEPRFLARIVRIVGGGPLSRIRTHFPPVENMSVKL